MSPVTWLDSVPSTSTALRDVPAENGDCIATMDQTAGRGRLGRDWVELSGKGLAVSMVVTEPVSVPTLVPLIAGSTAIDVLREMTGDADELWMKWPNDIYIGDKKVAGILTEMPTSERIVIGLGLNIFHATGELPVETATSLALHGLVLDPVAFVEMWRDGVLALMRATDTQSTVDRVNSRLGLRGESVRIDFPDGSHRDGVVRGVDSTGALLLDSGDPVIAGEITRLRRAD